MTLPAGTVSFLFTDIEGSTLLLHALGERYDAALEAHRSILRAAIDAHGGTVFGTEGDAVFAVFERAGDAVAAAVEAQRNLTAHPWPAGEELRVRMGVHTGDARLVGGDYVGLALHETARVCSAGHGGQVLVTGVTAALSVRGTPSPDRGGVDLRDLGEHRLKDLREPIRILQAQGPGLPDTFPPLRTLTVMPNNLPAATDAFVGRVDDLAQVVEGLSAHRLVTLTGAGGTGKSRLALEAAGAVLPGLRRRMAGRAGRVLGRVAGAGDGGLGARARRARRPAADRDAHRVAAVPRPPAAAGQLRAPDRRRGRARGGDPAGRARRSHPGHQPRAARDPRRAGHAPVAAAGRR